MPTRDAILDSATRLFAARGLDGVSIRDICTDAGVNVAAINYHFKGKDRLYEEVFERAYRAANLEAMPELEDAEGDAVAALTAWIAWYVKRTISAGDDTASQLLLREAANPTTALEGVVHATLHPVYRALDEIVETLLPEGHDARTRKVHCLSIIGQCLVHRVCRAMIERLPVEPALGVADRDFIASVVTRNAISGLERAAAETRR